MRPVNETVKIIIDGRELTVPVGTTVLRAALDNGIRIPHYCYHPGLSIDGNCRMCLVEVEKMPKPVPSCHLKVQDGMVIHTDTDRIKRVRRSIVEFQLLHHPLDCPICDQSGECYLQDYYFDYDLMPSRFEFEKIKRPKAKRLSEKIVLDNERCILCRRCVRYMREILKEPVLGVFGRGNKSYIDLAPGARLEGEYQYNLADICPVGALTSLDFRFKKRVWFLRKVKSICPLCSRGCYIYLWHDDRKFYRVTSRISVEDKRFWICDRSRKLYELYNENLELKPMLFDEELDEETLLDTIAGKLHPFIKDKRDGIFVYLSYWNSNEETDTILEFITKILGIDRIFVGGLPNENGDEFLYTGDRNPNRKGVEDRLKEASVQVFMADELKKENGEILIMFGTEGPWEGLDSIFGGFKEMILFGRRKSLSDTKRSIFFPVRSPYMSYGSFTNIDGYEASFSPSNLHYTKLSPYRDLSEIVNEISKRLEFI